MIDIEQDIFARPPRSARKPSQQPARITCRVCGTPATVPVDHPALLCEHCIGDLDATRAHVRQCVDANLARLDAVADGWLALRDASPARDRWEKVQTAMIGVAEKRITAEAFDRQWTLRKAEGGALAELMEQYDAYTLACDQISAELGRLGVAQKEINQAWLSKDGAAFAPPAPGPIEVRWAGPRCYATNGPRFTKWYADEAAALKETETW